MWTSALTSRNVCDLWIMNIKPVQAWTPLSSHLFSKFTKIVPSLLQSLSSSGCLLLCTQLKVFPTLLSSSFIWISSGSLFSFLPLEMPGFPFLDSPSQRPCDVPRIYLEISVFFWPLSQSTLAPMLCPSTSVSSRAPYLLSPFPVF